MGDREQFRVARFSLEGDLVGMSNQASAEQVQEQTQVELNLEAQSEAMVKRLVAEMSPAVRRRYEIIKPVFDAIRAEQERLDRTFSFEERRQVAIELAQLLDAPGPAETG